MTKSQFKSNELRTKYFGMPLKRVMDVPESDFAFVRGFFTSDQRDEAGDIITRAGTERAIPKYRRWKNVRFMHQPRPVAKVQRIGVEDGLEWNEVEIKVIDPEAVFMVRNDLLTALSVGILINIDDVDMMEDGGWLINDYALAEISLVDHPANYDAFLTTIKGISHEVARVRGSQEVVTYLDTIKEELMGEQEEITNKEDCACEDAIVIDQQDNQAESVLEESLDVEKSPPCRQEGESKDDCVSRKIPEILRENPDMDRDQAIAIAYSMCDKSCGEHEDAVEAVQEEPALEEGELIEDEVVEPDYLEYFDGEEKKAVIPYRSTGKADQGEAWSKPTLGDFTGKQWEELSASEKRRIAAHYTYSVNMPPETFGDLKLPHHKGSSSGVGPAVFRGVSAAWARKNQAGIPSGEMGGVESHLAKHYRDFGEEPPGDREDSLEGDEIITETIVEGETDPETVELENAIPEIDQVNVQDSLAELRQEVAVLRGLLETVAEALHREDEQASGEGSQAVDDGLQQRVIDLEAENQSLRAEIEELRLPDNREGLVKIVQAPELEESEPEEDQPKDGDHLKFAVRKYLRSKNL